MFKSFSAFLKKFTTLSYSEKYIILSLLLGLFGILAVYSASASFIRSDLIINNSLLVRQTAFLGVGAVFMLISGKISSVYYAKSSIILLLFSFLLMILLLIPGVSSVTYGAKRWIRFFGVGIQPSELLKLCLIIWLASFAAKRKFKINSFKVGILPVLVVLSFASGLLILQPDFGTIILLFFISFLILYFAGLSYKNLFWLFSISTALALLAIFSSTSRMERILSYLDPWSYQSSGGYQLVNSFIAFGSGGIVGRGIGNSLQKQYYLPFAHTDFIFATLAEEIGFVGLLVLVCIYFYMMWLGFKIALFCRDQFCRFLVFGCTCLLTLQTLLHISVTLGLIPTKGIGLPFISYGGSSLVIFLVSSGIVYRCGKENKT